MKGTTQKKSPSETEIEKVKKPGRGKNGGARPGSGRKKGVVGEVTKLREELADRIKNMGEELVEIEERNLKTGERAVIVKARNVALMEVLFNEGIKNKNIPAIKEFLDRTLGKARQPLEHSGTIESKTQERAKLTRAQQAALDAYHNALLEDE